MRHLSHECRFEAWFSRFQNANTKAKCKCKGKCIWKWFLCPKCGIYLMNAALKRDFLDFTMQIQRRNANAKANAYENVFYALNAAFISWMPLSKRDFFDFRMQIQRQNANAIGKCIWKWFLCPKCGIYLLNAALKRIFSISECKYKGKMQMLRQMHMKMVFMP